MFTVSYSPLSFHYIAFFLNDYSNIPDKADIRSKEVIRGEIQ